MTVIDVASLFAHSFAGLDMDEVSRSFCRTLMKQQMQTGSAVGDICFHDLALIMYPNIDLWIYLDIGPLDCRCLFMQLALLVGGMRRSGRRIDMETERGRQRDREGQRQRCRCRL